MSEKFKTTWYGSYRIIATEGYNFRFRRVENRLILTVAVHPGRLQAFYDHYILLHIPPTPTTIYDRLWRRANK